MIDLVKVGSLEIEDTSSLSQDAYLETCEWLFKQWAKYVRGDKLSKEYARKCRGLLSVVHQLYSLDQACPKHYRDVVFGLAERWESQKGQQRVGFICNV